MSLAGVGRDSNWDCPEYKSVALLLQQCAGYRLYQSTFATVSTLCHFAAGMQVLATVCSSVPSALRLLTVLVKAFR
jgi:hypothetical protein